MALGYPVDLYEPSDELRGFYVHKDRDVFGEAKE